MREKALKMPSQFCESLNIIYLNLICVYCRLHNYPGHNGVVDRYLNFLLFPTFSFPLLDWFSPFSAFFITER